MLRVVASRVMALYDASTRNPADVSGGMDCQIPVTLYPTLSIRPNSPSGTARPAATPPNFCAAAGSVPTSAMMAIDSVKRRIEFRSSVQLDIPKRKTARVRRGPFVDSHSSLERDTERDRDVADVRLH